MNVLGWAANLWGNNAALPSGAIDVIAVRQPDGSLICSPFHVKLGRSCKKGEKKLVKLRVNGKEVDVCMRLGPAGEAFFLKKVHDIEKLDEDSLIEAPIVGSVLMESVNTADEHQLPASTTPGETPRCDDSGASAFSADGKDGANLLDLNANETLPSEPLAAAPTDSCAPSVDKATPETAADIPASSSSSSRDPPPSAVGWIWRWGYLPVKSRTNLQGMVPSEEKCERGTCDETRETADDFKEHLSINDKQFQSTPHSDPIRLEAVNSPDFPFQSSLAMNTMASGKHKYPSNSSAFINECRACDDEQSPQLAGTSSRLELPDSLYFRALSLCGDKLAGTDIPSSPMELMELLYTHRVTQEMFLNSDSESFLADPRLVVIADDHLLNVRLARDLLTSAGSDPTALFHEDHAPQFIRHSAVQSAVQMLIAQFSEGESPPSWLGARISTWGQAVVDDLHCDSKSEHEYHDLDPSSLPHAASQTSLGYYTPKKNLSFERASSSHYLLENSGGRCKEDFRTWSSSNIGWKESFTDLVEAYRLIKKKDGLSAQKNAIPVNPPSMSGSGAGDNEHDDYFFHHDESMDEQDHHIRPAVSPVPVPADDCLDGRCSPPEVMDPDESLIVGMDVPPESVDDEPSELIVGSDPSKAIMDPNPSQQMASKDAMEGETDPDHFSLQDVAFEDISPEPPDGDFYESDTDSYLSLSMDEEESNANNSGSRGSASLSSLSFFGGHKSDGDNGAAAADGMPRRSKFRRYRYRKVLTPSREQLELFGLKDGPNELVFELDDCPPLITQLFVWPCDVRIVVADIEGVFMDSKAASGWISLLEIGKKAPSYRHSMINLFRTLRSQGYRILYIADSPSTVSNNNTNYSNTILNMVQNNLGQRLPEGPVFKSPDSLIRAFGPLRTEVFKAAALRGVRSLFPSSYTPFHAAFVSRESDVVAFERNAFPEGRIFLTSHDGLLRRILLNRHSSLTVADLDQLVPQVFPKVRDGTTSSCPTPSRPLPMPMPESPAATATPRKAFPSVAEASTTNPSLIKEENFSDFSFWRLPITPLEDF